MHMGSYNDTKDAICIQFKLKNSVVIPLKFKVFQGIYSELTDIIQIGFFNKNLLSSSETHLKHIFYSNIFVLDVH